MNVNEAVQEHLDLTARIKLLEKERDVLKEAIFTHMAEAGVDFVVGTEDDHSLKRIESVRWTLDTAKVKEEMGDAWVTARSKTSLVQSLRLSR